MNYIFILLLVGLVGLVLIILAAFWADSVKNRAPKGPKIVYTHYTDCVFNKE